MRVLIDASLPRIHEYLSEYFDLSIYDNYADLVAKIADVDILVCRSTLKVNENLLKNSRLKCVATASSGSDHIDKQYLQSKQIKVIDAKGTNAQAVCDYVLATLVWLHKQGYYSRNKVGIVGLGFVGSKLWKILNFLGFEVIGYDPLKNSHDYYKSCKLEDLYSVDIVCIHANLHANSPYPSLDLFNADLLKKLKPGVIIINAARGGIVNEVDLLQIDNIVYCTDVFLSEPNINKQIISYTKLCTPHIAGHTIEAKINAVKKIALELVTMFAKSLFKKTINPALFSIENNNHAFGYHEEFGDNINFKNLEFQNTILSRYNPFFETQVMKLADDKCKAFIELRKKHNFRHDFLKKD